MYCASSLPYPNFKPFWYISYYRISSFIRGDFSLQNNAKNLDPSYKTDLDFRESFWKGNPHLIAEFHETDLDILVVILEIAEHPFTAEYKRYLGLYFFPVS